VTNLLPAPDDSISGTDYFVEETLKGVTPKNFSGPATVSRASKIRIIRLKLDKTAIFAVIRLLTNPSKLLFHGAIR
jgi:hypothetical protein